MLFVLHLPSGKTDAAFIEAVLLRTALDVIVLQAQTAVKAFSRPDLSGNAKLRSEGCGRQNAAAERGIDLPQLIRRVRPFRRHFQNAVFRAEQDGRQPGLAIAGAQIELQPPLAYLALRRLFGPVRILHLDDDAVRVPQARRQAAQKERAEPLVPVSLGNGEIVEEKVIPQPREESIAQDLIAVDKRVAVVGVLFPRAAQVGKRPQLVAGKILFQPFPIQSFDLGKIREATHGQLFLFVAHGAIFFVSPVDNRMIIPYQTRSRKEKPSFFSAGFDRKEDAYGKEGPLSGVYKTVLKDNLFCRSAGGVGGKSR